MPATTNKKLNKKKERIKNTNNNLQDYYEDLRIV